jgi:hypothetical protein
VQIGRFLNGVYQRKRIHSALGYLTPAEFEAAYHARLLTSTVIPYQGARKCPGLEAQFNTLASVSTPTALKPDKRSLCRRPAQSSLRNMSGKGVWQSHSPSTARGGQATVFEDSFDLAAKPSPWST